MAAASARLQDPYADAAERFVSPAAEGSYSSLRVLGEIREKGFGGADRAPALPHLGALPFPVARHRSHGPHWAPLSVLDKDECVEMEVDSDVDARATAQAPPRKPKGGLHLQNWRDLVPPKSAAAKASKRKTVSVDEEIDVENRAKLLSMSPAEIAESQKELLQRLGSEKLNMLRRRGVEKQRNRLQATVNEDQAMTERETAESVEYRPRDDNKTAEDDVHGVSWTERVEAVKRFRFNMAGFVIGIDDEQAVVPGASERDIIRSEGDPAALGYTIKDAASLTRSAVPGQRVIGAQLLAAILSNAANGLVLHAAGEGTDWQAVWAYALGPHPELVLTLRLALDHTHVTALISCAKALYALLSCSQNEKFVSSSEALWPGEPLLYTAPVFRQRSTANDGFLGSGNWKYNVKATDLSKTDAPKGDEDNTATVAEDDNTVASKDVAAGLLRMGTLERIRYMLEVEKSLPAEEPLLSVIIGFVRHSPAAADAVMTCPRLMDTVIHGFLLQSDCLETSRTKAIELLKVLSQVSKSYCIQFAQSGALQAASSELFKRASRKTAQSLSKQSSLIESLRLWRVCIYHDIGIPLFSDFYPALCVGLLPSAEGGIEAQECYTVLEVLARKLPVLKQKQVSSEAGWSWSIAVPVIHNSLDWLVVSDSRPTKVGVLGAVLHFLATVCERIVDEDSSVYGWLPEFVPQVGLAFVRSKLLNFGRENSRGGTLVSTLLEIRGTAATDRLLPLVNCLRGAVRLAYAIDKLLGEAGEKFRELHGTTEDELILHSGLVSSAKNELERLVPLVGETAEKSRVLLEEFNGRGGPAPGVGFGWGSLFWTPELLLAQSYAGILLNLDEVLQLSLQAKLSLCRVWFEPSALHRAFSDHIFSKEQWLSTLTTALRRLDGRGTYQLSEVEAGRESLIQHYTGIWLQRKKRKQESAELYAIQEDDSDSPLLREWKGTRLPLPVHWSLSALHSAMDADASPETVMAGLLLLLGGEEEGDGTTTTRKVHALSTVFAAGDLFLDAHFGHVLEVLQDVVGCEQSEVDFEGAVVPSYDRFAEKLALQFTFSSYGNVSFGRQLSFYLRPRVAFSIQQSVWRVLAEAKMLNLLPSVDECPGPRSAYLTPPQDNVQVVEMYVSTWISGGLDKAFARRGLAFELALHHIGHFLFKQQQQQQQEQDALLIHHRKKLTRNMIRSIKRSRASEDMFKELLRWCEVENAADAKLIIEDACGGDLSALDGWRGWEAGNVRERI